MRLCLSSYSDSSKFFRPKHVAWKFKLHRRGKVNTILSPLDTPPQGVPLSLARSLLSLQVASDDIILRTCQMRFGGKRWII